ncbi:MAG: hypothetical protein ABJ275_01630, partial [Maricaulaceae bacterium]
AQSSTQKAQAHYFTALEAFDSGDYQGALDGVQKAEAISGKTGDVLLKLETKALFRLGRYQEAKSTLNELYRSGPSDQSKREMASILVGIDEKIEEERRQTQQRQAQELRLKREFAAINPREEGRKLRTRVDENLKTQVEDCFVGHSWGAIHETDYFTYPNGTGATSYYNFKNAKIGSANLSNRLNGETYKIRTRVDLEYHYREKINGRQSSRWSRKDIGGGHYITPSFNISLRPESVVINGWNGLKFSNRDIGFEVKQSILSRVTNSINRQIKSRTNCIGNIRMTNAEKTAYSKNANEFSNGFSGATNVK